MSETFIASCPLCRSPAKCEGYIGRRLKHFICGNCTEFVIKNRAESWFVGASAQAIEHFSDAAKAAPDGEILLIFRSPGADPAVEAKYISLEEALRQ